MPRYSAWQDGWMGWISLLLIDLHAEYQGPGFMWQPWWLLLTSLDGLMVDSSSAHDPRWDPGLLLLEVCCCVNYGELKSGYQVSRSDGHTPNQGTEKYTWQQLQVDGQRIWIQGQLWRRSSCLPETNRMIGGRARNQLRSVQLGCWHLVTVLLFWDTIVRVLIPLWVYQGLWAL